MIRPMRKLADMLTWTITEKQKPESIVDRKYRLASELAALSEEDAREVVRFARPKMHLARNGKGRRAKNGQADIS